MAAQQIVADKHIGSSYGYFSGYKPDEITEQITRLKKLFPELGSADESIAEGELPSNAEGWFAVPRWQVLADSYGEAVQRVLDKIKEARNSHFYSFCRGRLGPQYFRQSKHTACMLKQLSDAQSNSDILVMPAQSGLLYQGLNALSVHKMINRDIEFGLGTFAAGTMLLTHPNRLLSLEDLWVGTGDKFTPHANGKFSQAPYFCFGSCGLELRVHWVKRMMAHNGFATGFLPPA